MIDLHCHLLPGVDDGPRTLDAAIAIARYQLAAGVDTVVATPHVSPRYRNDAATIARGLAALQAALLHAGVPLRVLPGAEIDLAMGRTLDDGELRRLALGGGRWLLIEAPLQMQPNVAHGIQELMLRGHRILLAHPERSPVFQRDPRLLRDLVEAGALCQVNAGSLTGHFGPAAQRAAEQLAAQEQIDVLASDAHDVTARPPGLYAAVELERGRELTVETPAALLAGDVPARRPAVSRPRRRLALGRHR